MRKYISFLLLLLLLEVTDSFAQPKNPGATSDTDDSNQDIDTAPISGIEWLLLAGGIFGGRRVYGKFKKKSDR